MKLLFFPFSLFLFLFSLSHASELTMGDLNGDGEVNLIDTVLMVNHIQGTEYITDSDALKWKADVNGDGLVNSFDVEESLNFVFKREPKKQMPKTSVLATSPYHGEGNIALTREFVVRFTMPLKEGTVITDDSFYAHSAGDLMITSARLSSDRMKATLFLGGFRWPSNSKVTVTFRGTGLTDFLDRELDLDGDGSPGGHGEWTFSTLAVEASDPSTVVKGRVLDSDNSNGERPLGGVIISVVGNEEQFTTLSDVNGYFTLTSAPVGRFFVVVDGRLVGAGAGETLADDLWKERDYYTFVGKAWEGVPGKEVNATKYGKYDDSGAYQPSPKDGNIYLPLVKKGALQSVSSSTDTEIAFATGYLEEASPEQAAMLHATSITIPPGSLQADDGTQGGSVGIAPVDPERLPEPLPESLAMPLVITIQTDGASNFDVPVPARFPNVDNLPPGTKSALWSFDHDTGVWEISGPMTVSEDGKYLETDPGVGIRQPGWHGASPGAQVFGTAVITGPTISKPTPGACGLTQEQMELTEQEFTDLGRLSEGIEETIFGANDEDISFSKEILSAGHHFAKGSAKGGKNWDLFRNHVYRDASLHQEIASKAVQLLGNDSFWAAFISTAGVMKDNALIAMIDQSKRDQINQAHLTFLQKHTVAKEQITKQLNKWEKYLQSVGALLGETSLVINYSTIQGNRGELGRTISLVSKAFRALPGGRKRLDSCLKRYAKDWQNFIESTLDGNLHAYKGESFVFLKRIGSDKEENRLPPIAAQRIRVGTGGAYDAIVRPNSWYEAWMLEPTTLVIGCTTFISPRNGGNGPVPPIPLCKDDKPDSDYDYLSDRGERVVGTQSQQSDTDGDGIPDGFEIMNGTDPSGGNPVFTGILATIPTPDRVFSDSIVTGNDLAILGNGPHGIEIFDIGAGVRPIKLAGIDTPGSVRRAALSGNFLAIADAGAGLTVVDLSNPEVPSIRFNLKQESPANAVAVYGGVAFVGLENGTIHSFDLFSGQPIDQVSPGQLVEDLGILGRHLIVLTHKNKQHSMLHSIPFVNGRFGDDDGEFARVDPINTPGFRQWGLGNGLGRRLFVGDEFAYVTDLMGFTHFDLSDHSTPVKQTRTKTRARGWRQIVANGSGLAVNLEHPNSPKFALADPGVYTVDLDGSFLRPASSSDPQYVENFETRFPTPGNAGDLSIYNGLAYIADGYSGLQVVNYRSYDINGIPPDLNVSVTDSNGTTVAPDGQVEEAKAVTLRVSTYDDVQVKNIDFFVDGERVFVDGSYPFSYTVTAPLYQDKQSFTLRVISRDTGGNEAYWPGPGAADVYRVNVSEDMIPPEVITYYPKEDSTVFPGEIAVVVFNERMDPESITPETILLHKVLENGETIPVEVSTVIYDDATQSAYLTLPGSIGPARYRLFADGNATDLAGNPLVTPTPARHLNGPGELHGTFWFDKNHNTQQEQDEEPLSDWIAFLDYNNNGELDPGEPTALADSAGNYSFTGLRPGGYSVAEEIPYGWVQTFPRERELGNEEDFTNEGWIYQGDAPSVDSPASALAVDSLGYGWSAGITPEGNFSLGSLSLDGNNTAGQLYLARLSPTGLVDLAHLLGRPDGAENGVSPALLLQADQDGGVWLSGSFSGATLSIAGETLDANGTQSSFLARFSNDGNVTYLNSFPDISITSLSPDPEGRLALAGVFSGGAVLSEDYTLEANGSTDGFITVLKSTGELGWARSLGGSLAESVESVSIDPIGRVWIAGDSNSSQFSTGNHLLDLSGDAGGYLALYDAHGNDLWAIDPAGMLSVTDDGTGAWFLDYNGSLPVLRFVDDNGSEHARATITGSTVHQLAATSDGNAIASLRSSSSQVSINGESVFSGESNQSLLVKLKTNGAVAWTLPLGGHSSTIGLLARGSDDFVWAMGEVTGDEGEVLSHGDYSISLQGGGSVTDGLVAWYPFDGNAQDMSGNGNHGTALAIAFSPDRNSNSLHALDTHFSNNYVSFPSFNETVRRNFSFTFWAKPSGEIAVMPETQTGNYSHHHTQPLWAADHGNWANAEMGIGISLGFNGLNVLQHTNDIYSSILSLSGELSGWLFYSISFSNNIPSLSINGIYQKEGLASYNTATLSRKIGKDSYGEYNGLIDDVRIYNRALSQEEITQLYQGSVGSGEQSVLLKVDPSGEVAGLWRTSSPTDSLLVDAYDNVWTSGLHSGETGVDHNLSLGSRNLLGDAANSRFFGRIGRGGAEYHNVQLGAAEVITGLDFGNALPLVESRTAMCVGGPDEDASRAVVTDPAGNAYYAGDFTGYTEFGGRRLESDGQNDAMFVKFLPGGEIDWARNFGGDGDDLGHGIFADNNGSLFVCGTFQGTAQFGEFELVSAGMRDLFVSRLDDNGSPLWAFRAGGPEDDEARGLIADSNGSLYVAGSVKQTADFGPYSLTSRGGSDAYLLKLDYNGSVQWVGSLMSEDTAQITALSLDAQGLPVVAGDFAGTLELRGTGHADDGTPVVIRTDTNQTVAYGDPVGQSPDLSLGLVAWYPFDGNASDMSGNGNHATVNGPTLTYDINFQGNAAYQFDGIDDAIVLPQEKLLDGEESATITMWFKLGYGFSSGQLLGAGDARNGTDPISMRISNTGTEDFGFCDTKTSLTLKNMNVTLSELQTSRWQMISLVLQNSNEGPIGSTVSTYLGSDLVTSSSIDSEFSISYDQAMVANIGNLHTSGQYFKGSIDEVRIYNRALLEEEILYLYLNGLGVTLSYSLDGSLPQDANSSGYSFVADRSGYSSQAISLVNTEQKVSFAEYNTTHQDWAQSFWIKPEFNDDSNQSIISLSRDLNLTIDLDITNSSLNLTVFDQNKSTGPISDENGAFIFVENLGNNYSGAGTKVNPYQSISKAIQVANSGDTIWVEPGTYRGSENKNLNLFGKELTIKSTDGPEQTIIDCEGNGRAFHVQGGETNAKIMGFTIKNGSQGGVRVENGSNASFWYCNIIGNTSSESGPAAGGVTGGSYYYCKINDNVGNGEGPWNSGLAGGATRANLNFCEIRRNVKRHNDNEAAGGINHSTARFCLITDNTSTGNIRVAGGVAFSTVTNSILYNNQVNARMLTASGAIWSTFTNTIVWRPSDSFNEMRSAPSYGNGTTNPMFLNATQGDFRFDPDSTMINAGDPNSPSDQDGSRADIGFDIGLLEYNYPSYSDPTYVTTDIPLTELQNHSGWLHLSFWAQPSIFNSRLHFFINGAYRATGELLRHLTVGEYTLPGLTLLGENYTGGLDDYHLIVGNLGDHTIPSIYQATADSRLRTNPKLQSAGQKDFFVAQFDENGRTLNATHGAGTGIDAANGIALGSMGEFYLTGIYGPSLTLGQKQANGDSQLINAYLAQLDEDLKTRWIKTVGGGGLNRGESVAVDAKGRAFFVGSYSGTAHFDERSLTARGGSDAYLAEFDYRGNLLRLYSHGGTSSDSGTAVALNNDGGIILTGTYRGEAEIFDGEHICHEHGGTDVFVARYDYGIDEPQTHYTVKVAEDDNGTEIILLNDEPAPEVELIPGLTYTFELDGNTTDEHPFVIVEEEGADPELWDVEEDVNNSGATQGTVVIKVDEETPEELGYTSGNKPTIGGGIVVKQDPKPKYRLTIAQFDDGNNSVHGADIRVFKNSQEVSLDEPFEEGTRLRVELKERDDYIFEGWVGDLPNDAAGQLNKAHTFVLNMDRDRDLLAYFSTPAPDDPRDFLDEVILVIQGEEVDENGDKVGNSVPYIIIFTVDQDGIKEDGTSGSVRVIGRVNENGTINEDLDFDDDGRSDVINGRFIFEQTDTGEGTFRIVNMTATLATGEEWIENGEKVEPWGGNMEMSIVFQKDNGGKETGNFVMFKDDATVDQGGWESEKVRKDFSL